MQIAHEAFQPLLQHMGIDLRGRDIGVAEKRLHHAQIGAIVQEVAGEGMAQHVRAQLRRAQAAAPRQRLEFAGEMLAGEMAAVRRTMGTAISRRRVRRPLRRRARDSPPSPAWRRR